MGNYESMLKIRGLKPKEKKPDKNDDQNVAKNTKKEK